MRLVFPRRGKRRCAWRGGAKIPFTIVQFGFLI